MVSSQQKRQSPGSRARRRCAGWIPAIGAVAALVLGLLESRAQTGANPLTAAWEKTCNSAAVPNQRACFTARRIMSGEGGETSAAVTLIQPDEGQTLLRMTLPLNLQLKFGMRVLVDLLPATQVMFVYCGKDGCVADHVGADDLVAQMKTGTTLTLQGIDLAGKQVDFRVPLADFAKVVEASDKPPEEQGKVLEQDLPRRAAELRRRMEETRARQTPAPVVAPAPAAAASPSPTASYRLQWSKPLLTCMPSIAVSADERSIAIVAIPNSQSPGSFMMVFDSANGDVREQHLDRGKHLLSRLALTRDGKYIVTGFSNNNLKGGGVQIVARPGGAIVKTIDLPDAPESLALSPDGERVLVVSHLARDAYLLNIKTGATVLKVNHRTADEPDAKIAFSMLSPNGARAVTVSFMGDEENPIRLWDVATGKLLAGTTFPSNTMDRVQFFPDGKKMIIADLNGNVWLFNEDLKGASVVANHPTTEKINPADAVVSSDGRRVVSIASTGQVKVNDAETGADLQSFVAYPKGVKHRVAALADDRIVTLGSEAPLKCFLKMWTRN